MPLPYFARGCYRGGTFGPPNYPRSLPGQRTSFALKRRSYWYGFLKAILGAHLAETGVVVEYFEYPCAFREGHWILDYPSGNGDSPSYGNARYSIECAWEKTSCQDYAAHWFT